MEGRDTSASTRGLDLWAVMPTAICRPCYCPTNPEALYRDPCPRSSYGDSYYYVGYRRHYYHYCADSMHFGSSMYILGPQHYGCYSCSPQTCTTCSGCFSRKACGHDRIEEVLAGTFDRYELAPNESLTTPPAGSPRWPLRLQVYNASLLVERTNASYSSISREV